MANGPGAQEAAAADGLLYAPAAVAEAGAVEPLLGELLVARPAGTGAVAAVAAAAGPRGAAAEAAALNTYAAATRWVATADHSRAVYTPGERWVREGGAAVSAVGVAGRASAVGAAGRLAAVVAAAQQAVALRAEAAGRLAVAVEAAAETDLLPALQREAAGAGPALVALADVVTRRWEREVVCRARGFR